MNNVISKNTIWSSLLLLGAFCGLCTASYASSSPVGLWRSIDDETGKPRSLIEISENRDRTLSGYVRKVFKIGHKEPRRYCDQCQGDLKNARIVGMRVLWGVMQDTDDEWSGGKILDPSTGDTYRVKLRVIESGQRLRVRGYLGIALFGRTQTWERVR